MAKTLFWDCSSRFPFPNGTTVTFTQYVRAPFFLVSQKETTLQHLYTWSGVKSITQDGLLRIRPTNNYNAQIAIYINTPDTERRIFLDLTTNYQTTSTASNASPQPRAWSNIAPNNNQHLGEGTAMFSRGRVKVKADDYDGYNYTTLITPDDSYKTYGYRFCFPRILNYTLGTLAKQTGNLYSISKFQAIDMTKLYGNDPERVPKTSDAIAYDLGITNFSEFPIFDYTEGTPLIVENGNLYYPEGATPLTTAVPAELPHSIDLANQLRINPGKSLTIPVVPQTVEIIGSTNPDIDTVKNVTFRTASEAGQEAEQTVTVVHEGYREPFITSDDEEFKEAGNTVFATIKSEYKN
jgi:hypothetical protein